MGAKEIKSPAAAKPDSGWPGQPNQPASLDRLPPEILLQIITSFPHLGTLWNLLRASPHAWRLFNSHALTITEGVLSGPNSILPPKIQQLVRGVMLARSEALPFRNLEEFHHRFMRGMIPPPKRNDSVFIPLGPETLSPSNVPVAVLLSVVATAYQISALSQAYLASCLARLRDPSFRPLHAFDPTPQYPHDYRPVGDWIPGRDREVVSTPVKVVDTGQPGWVEEMRVLRAMWIIQLTGEVQYLVADKAGTTCWSNQDIEMLSKLDATDLVTIGFTVGDSEDVKSVMWYLGTLGDTTKDIYYRLPRPPPASASTRWITALPKPEEYTWVPIGFRRNGEFHWLRKGSLALEDATLVNHRECSDAFRWGQTEHALDMESPGMRLFRSFSLWSDDGRASPILGVKFDSFRPLGLAFWDLQRMHLLGLANGIHSPRYCDNFYLYAWESILPPDEVASLKAGLRKQRVDRLL